MSTIGIDKLHIAHLTKDDETGCTYSTPYSIPGLIEADIEPQTNSTTLYADNIAYAVATGLGETKVTLNVEDLPQEVYSKLLGHTIESGVTVCNAEDQPLEVAVMFESKKRDGSIKYIKLLKGKFQEPSENPKTATDTPDFVTPTIEGTFIARKCDKVWKMTAESSNKAFTGAKTWYDEVGDVTIAKQSGGGGNG